LSEPGVVSIYAGVENPDEKMSWRTYERFEQSGDSIYAQDVDKSDELDVGCGGEVERECRETKAYVDVDEPADGETEDGRVGEEVNVEVGADVEEGAGAIVEWAGGRVVGGCEVQRWEGAEKECGCEMH
jgi:hypothetical protein